MPFLQSPSRDCHAGPFFHGGQDGRPGAGHDRAEGHPKLWPKIGSSVTFGRIVTRWMWIPTNLTKEEIVERALTIEDAPWLCQRIGIIFLLILVASCRLMSPCVILRSRVTLTPSVSQLWQEDTQISKGIREVLYPCAFLPCSSISFVIDYS